MPSVKVAGKAAAAKAWRAMNPNAVERYNADRRAAYATRAKGKSA
jgi:hypothetical protein